MVISNGGTVEELGGWAIRTLNGSIASTENEERLAADLNLKLPTMIFDSSVLELRRLSSNFSLSFNAHDALAGVGPADPSIQVRAAANWEGKSDRTDVGITKLRNASDWTFTTKYAGTFTGSVRYAPNDRSSELVEIDYDALRNVDIPIRLFSEVILFEDELDDNGTASYKVRIVSPSLSNYAFLVVAVPCC